MKTQRSNAQRRRLQLEGPGNPRSADGRSGHLRRLGQKRGPGLGWQCVRLDHLLEYRRLRPWPWTGLADRAARRDPLGTGEVYARRNADLGQASRLRVLLLRLRRRRQRVRWRRAGEGRGLRGRRRLPLASAPHDRQLGYLRHCHRLDGRLHAGYINGGSVDFDPDHVRSDDTVASTADRARSPTSPSEASTAPCSGSSRSGVRVRVRFRPPAWPPTAPPSMSAAVRRNDPPGTTFPMTNQNDPAFTTSNPL